MKNKVMSPQLLFVILIFSATGFIMPVRAADTTNDVLLNKIPADSLFCLRINNFNQSLAGLDQYLIGASPIPVSTAMLISMQMGAIVGDPMLTGIDMGGNFGVFAVAPQADQTQPLVGMLIPVKNFKEFVSSNSNCKPAENGLSLLAGPNSPLGNFLLAPAGDTYALVVNELDKAAMPPLQKALAGDSKLIKRLSPAQSKEAVSAPVWAFMNLEALYEKYNKEAQGMIQAAQAGSAVGTPPGMQDMMTLYFNMLKGLFNEFAGQADSMTLSLHPEPAQLSIDAAFRAKNGTDLAQMFVPGNYEPGYSLTGYLDNDNAVNGLVKMDAPSLVKFYDMMFDVMAESTEDPALKEQTNKMKALTQKGINAIGDEVSFSYNYTKGQPPFKLQEVVNVKDAAAMKAMMAESLEYANELYKGMGIPAKLEYQPAVSTYKNATIDVVKIAMTKTDDPNDIMQQEMAKMYGDNFKYYLAHTTDKFYVAMGPDGEQKLKALIDQPTLSAAPAGDIKIAMDTLKNTPYRDFVCSVNIIKLIKGMGEMLQSVPEQPCGMPFSKDLLTKLDVESQSALVLGGQVADGQASMRLALPKQHLIEIIALGVQIQQQMAPPVEQSQPIAPTPMPAE